MPLKMKIEDVPPLAPGEILVSIACVVKAPSAEAAINNVCDNLHAASFEFYVGPTITR